MKTPRHDPGGEHRWRTAIPSICIAVGLTTCRAEQPEDTRPSAPEAPVSSAPEKQKPLPDSPIPDRDEVTPSVRALFEAIRRQDHRTIIAQVEADPSLLEEHEDPDTVSTPPVPPMLPLFEATRYSDPATVQLLLDLGAETNATLRGGEGVLQHVFEPALVPLLVAAGADPNHRDQRDYDPILFAASRGHFDVVQALVQAGGHVGLESKIALGDAEVLWDDFEEDPSALVSNAGRFLKAPLHHAAESGTAELTELLLLYGAKLDGSDVSRRSPYRRYVPGGIRPESTNTPLVTAVLNGRIDVVQALLTAGSSADTEQANSRLRVGVLAIALLMDDSTCAEALLRHGADADASTGFPGWSLLDIAISNGDRAIVKALLDAGAPVDDLDSPPLPLEVAAADGHWALHNWLRDERGAIPTLLSAGLSNDHGAIRRILGRDPDAHDQIPALGLLPTRVSILGALVGRSDPSTIELLLKLGANPNAPGEEVLEKDPPAFRPWVEEEPRWPVDVAVERGSIEILDSLVEYGMSLRGADGTMSQHLDAAIRFSHLDVGAWLIQRGANPSVPTRRGSLLSRAMYCPDSDQRLPWIKMFLDAGADPDGHGSSDRLLTMIDYGAPPPILSAARMGDQAAVDLLLAAGAHHNLESAARCGDRESLETLANFPNLDLEDESAREVPRLLATHGHLDLLNEHHGATEGFALSLQEPVDLGAAAYEAIQGDRVEVLAALLNRGLPVNRALPWGSNLLYEAAERGDSEAVHLLIDAGADLDRTGGDRGATPLLAAIAVSRSSDTAIALLRAGADPDVRWHFDGSMPLHYAAQRAMDRVVRSLLEHGASLNCRDCTGNSALARVHFRLHRRTYVSNWTDAFEADPPELRETRALLLRAGATR